ncbi:FUS1 [[Candida] subhashii]|uniref:FUS1 n=1 Tax=[Candida] subhashii TaxID=561895 RepID=A0A8J5QNZ4_9ASCO|nr:FUS1 [[Candida] subhashii]KAG7663986.1 FUS1 [[Candida] subhashii]
MPLPIRNRRLRARDDDDDDTTVYLTLTSTTTLPPSETSKSDENLSISWLEQTLTTSIVTRVPITFTTSTTATPTPSTSQNTNTNPIATNTAENSNTETGNTEIYTQQTSSKSSVNAGLAIGIPVALFSAFFLGLAVWYIIRLRNLKKKNNSDNESDYSHSGNDDSTLIDTKGGPTFPYNSNQDENLTIKPGAERQIKPDSIKYKLRDRLSKTGLFGDYYANNNSPFNDPPEPKSPIMQRISEGTPVFLKTFRLNNKDDANSPQDSMAGIAGFTRHEKIKPQTLSIPDRRQNNNNFKLLPKFQVHSNDDEDDDIEPELDVIPKKVSKDIHIVIRPYLKNLDDELTISVGDKVELLKKHADSWCTVKVIRTAHMNPYRPNEIGLVPKMCLQRLS